VTDSALYFFITATVTFGVAHGIFLYGTAHGTAVLSTDEFWGVHMLMMSSHSIAVILYSIHRILRPSDRGDPLRTILELEAVDVCLNALDGCNLMYLDEVVMIGSHLTLFCRIVGVAWFIFVAIQVSALFLVHTPRGELKICNVVIVSLDLSIKERIRSALRFRAFVVCLSVPAELSSICARSILLFSTSGVTWIPALAAQGLLLKNCGGLWRSITVIARSCACRQRKQEQRWWQVPARGDCEGKVKVCFRGLKLVIILVFFLSYVGILVLQYLFCIHVGVSLAVWIPLGFEVCIWCMSCCCMGLFVMSDGNVIPEIAGLLGCGMICFVLVNIIAEGCIRIPLLLLHSADLPDVGWFSKSTLVHLFQGNAVWMFLIGHAMCRAVEGEYRDTADASSGLVRDALAVEMLMDVLSSAEFASVFLQGGLSHSMSRLVLAFVVLEFVNACLCSVWMWVIVHASDSESAHTGPDVAKAVRCVCV
jgi:hypothetical protein